MTQNVHSLGPQAPVRSFLTPACPTNHQVAIEATAEIAPFEQIVFGTDWPYLALPDGRRSN